MKKDRISKYLKKYLDGFLFAPLQLSELNELSPLSMLKGADIPFREADIVEFQRSGSLSHAKLTENIIYILGVDPGFTWNTRYRNYLLSFWGLERICSGTVKTGQELAKSGDFERASIFFRAALVLEGRFSEPSAGEGGGSRVSDKPEEDPLYLYAHALRQNYLNSDAETEGEEYVGSFKAEALDAFEQMSLAFPDFPDAHYYLGYAYVNLGLYTKAKLEWEAFIEKSAGEGDTALNDMMLEIKARLSEIKSPVEIERAVNDISRGDFAKGLNVLEPYAGGETSYSRWWPMYFFMGIAYESLGHYEKAVDSFRRVLSLNASHRESTEELSKLYRLLGDSENAEKYERKLELL